MKVIGVVGYARAGKDTFCAIAKEILEKNGGKMLDVSSPKNTLENLFLDIVRESKSRPGARGIIGSGDDNGSR